MSPFVLLITLAVNVWSLIELKMGLGVDSVLLDTWGYKYGIVEVK